MQVKLQCHNDSSHLKNRQRIGNKASSAIERATAKSSFADNILQPQPFYCLKLSEKEKQSCLCINWLNPNVILESYQQSPS